MTPPSSTARPEFPSTASPSRASAGSRAWRSTAAPRATRRRPPPSASRTHSARTGSRSETASPLRSLAAGAIQVADFASPTMAEHRPGHQRPLEQLPRRDAPQGRRPQFGGSGSTAGGLSVVSSSPPSREPGSTARRLPEGRAHRQGGPRGADGVHGPHRRAGHHGARARREPRLDRGQPDAHPHRERGRADRHARGAARHGQAGRLPPRPPRVLRLRVRGRPRRADPAPGDRDARRGGARAPCAPRHAASTSAPAAARSR